MIVLFSLIRITQVGFSAWQEPHNEQHITETSRSTTVIPVEHPNFQSTHSESVSMMKYIEENTNVSVELLQISRTKIFPIRLERNGIVC